MAGQMVETDIKTEIVEGEKNCEYSKLVELSPVKDEIYSDTPEYVQVDSYKAFGDINFECGECSTKFKESEYLQIHLLIHQSDQIPESCQLCGFMLDFSKVQGKSKRKKKYVGHINKHIKDKMAENRLKNTKCEFCGRIVTSANKLAIHLRVHTNERPYACTICDKTFKQLGSLKTHLDSHAPNKFFACELCNGNYSTSSSLKRHQRKMHDTGRSMVCRTCSQKFYNLTDLRNHKQDEHSQKVKIRNCIYCNMEFSSYRMYKKHVATHADSRAVMEKKRIERRLKRSTFKCQLCGEVLFDKKLLNSHMDQHLQYTQKDYEEAKEKGKLSCKICSRIFNRRRSLFAHMSCHMAKTHTCDECGKCFSYYSLLCHRRLVHMSFDCKICKETLKGAEKKGIHNKKYHSQIRQYKCTICNKILFSKYTLNSHYLMSHNEAEKPKCNICGRKFLTESSLSVHKVHSRCHSITKYKCSFCDRVFKHENYLKEHNRYVHEDNKEYLVDAATKTYTCLICKTVKKGYKTLLSHMRKHKIFRKFRCKICMKYFNSKQTLDMHVKNEVCVKFLQKVRNMESGIEYKCNICSKLLNSKKYLLGHIIYHSVEYRKCRICGVQYKNIKHIRRHMKNKHPNEKTFHCVHCDISFDMYQDMRLHAFSEEHKSRCGIDIESIEHHFKVTGIKNLKVEEENADIEEKLQL